MSGFWAAVGALAPPVGVGLVFWLVMRWIVQADRRERAAQAALDARQGAPQAAQDAPLGPPDAEGPTGPAPAAEGRGADVVPGAAEGSDRGAGAPSTARGNAARHGSAPAPEAGSGPRPTGASLDSSAPLDGGDELA